MEPRGQEPIWTQYSGTWATLCREPGLDVVGLAIHVRHEVNGLTTVEELLVGDINAMGGRCDDDGLKGHAIVLRYRRVYGG